MDIAEDEKLVCVIAIGYGENQGKPHKSKPIEKLCKEDLSKMPDWFKAGVDAALKAPTAINQQKFIISMENDEAVIFANIEKNPCCNCRDCYVLRYQTDIY